MLYIYKESIIFSYDLIYNILNRAMLRLREKGNSTVLHQRAINKEYVEKAFSKSSSSSSKSSSSGSDKDKGYASTPVNWNVGSFRNNRTLTKVIAHGSDKIILRDVKITRDMLDVLDTLEVSAITHFVIIKTKEEEYETDNYIIYGLLFMIENMTNIKVLDFSGFHIDNSKYSYIEGDDDEVLHTTNFVELFTGILLKLKKLKYLNFSNNIIDAKSYNEIFRFRDHNAKPDTSNAVMMITDTATDDKKIRKVKFNTRNCSTPKFKNPLISYKNPAVDRQIKKITKGIQ